MLSGVLPIFKPSGISSYEVIRIIKKQFSRELKKSKIGHSGTLDPLAEGVLVLLIGKGTSLFDLFLKSEKYYQAEFQFGAETDTDDLEGNVINTSDIKISRDAVIQHLNQFIGIIDQIPPNHSAVHVNGKRSYELARKNIPVQLKPKRVEISNFSLINFDEETQYGLFEIHCSSGTYIRSLARDLGQISGCGAHMTKLKRIFASHFHSNQCLQIDQIKSDSLKDIMIPLTQSTSFLPEIILMMENSEIINGKKIENSLVKNDLYLHDGFYRVLSNDQSTPQRLLAIIKKENHRYSYYKVFPNYE